MAELCMSTASVGGTLSSKLDAIAAAGFKAIDLYDADVSGFDGSPEQLADLARDHGLQINLLLPFRDLEGLDGLDRQRAFDRLEAKLDLAQRLGTRLLVVQSTRHSDATADDTAFVRDLVEAGDRARSRGMRIAYQPLDWARHVRTLRHANDLVEKAGHSNVGLALNSLQISTSCPDMACIGAIPVTRIFSVQVCDAPNLDMSTHMVSSHFQCFPGLGDVDLESFVRQVAAVGYTGIWSIEVSSDKLRQADPCTAAKGGYRSLVSLLDRMARQKVVATPNLPKMPDRVGVEKIAFLEFAVGSPDVALLSGTLSKLGFSRKAHHLAKSVELWQQGDARIVLNTEMKGFAHSAYLMHGTSVCDIGLQVTNARATLSRAIALGSTEFRQPVGPGELKIPAIRGIGGSVLHLIDGSSSLAHVWETEFVPIKGEQAKPSFGITGIDHIAQPMNLEEMQRWALFYISTLKVKATALVDVRDPSGLIHSQVIENEGGGLRLNLNGVDTHRTSAGAFLADHFGAPVQHIAFACEDIFAISQNLADAGLARLKISPNYYDDLKAVFALDAAFVEKLKTADILYDRDGDAEYFQIYSQPLFDGFFFEIVERRNGYAGYGARNAPIRLAAMKRHMRPPGLPRP